MGIIKDCFKIQVQNNNMKAYLVLQVNISEVEKMTVFKLREFLFDSGISYGIKDNVLSSIAENPQNSFYPLLVAEGKQRVDGDNAYLIRFDYNQQKKQEDNQAMKVDFKQINDIPFVTNGQLIATKIGPTKGDIRVLGTVESATLISDGSIYIGNGIMGQQKGIVKSKGDLHTNFINQGNVELE